MRRVIRVKNLPVEELYTWKIFTRSTHAFRITQQILVTRISIPIYKIITFMIIIIVSPLQKMLI